MLDSIIKWLYYHYYGVDVKLVLDGRGAGWFFWNASTDTHEKIGIQELRSMFGNNLQEVFELTGMLDKVSTTRQEVFNEVL